MEREEKTVHINFKQEYCIFLFVFVSISKFWMKSHFFSFSVMKCSSIQYLLKRAFIKFIRIIWKIVIYSMWFECKKVNFTESMKRWMNQTKKNTPNEFPFHGNSKGNINQPTKQNKLREWKNNIFRAHSVKDGSTHRW